MPNIAYARIPTDKCPRGIKDFKDMRLTRVFVTASLEPGAVVELPPETASHLAKVLRARSGDEITLFSGDGLEYAGEIVRRGPRILAAVGIGRAVDRESPFAVT
jgi:16S rRNA (uracil1498-N3)-methyltransferase